MNSGPAKVAIIFFHLQPSSCSRSVLSPRNPKSKHRGLYCLPVSFLTVSQQDPKRNFLLPHLNYLSYPFKPTPGFELCMAYRLSGCTTWLVWLVSLSPYSHTSFLFSRYTPVYRPQNILKTLNSTHQIRVETKSH